MALFSLEYSKSACLIDFISYGLVISGLIIYLIFSAPFIHRFEMLVLFVLGFFASTLIEYGMHRFILHGVQPFQCWYEIHHARPTALLGTPIILSMALIAFFAFLPALLLGDLLLAIALTLGLSCAYLFFTLTHYAAHHWRAYLVVKPEKMACQPSSFSEKSLVFWCYYRVLGCNFSYGDDKR
ncbi:hypothetical protein [Undibacterium sp. TJN19]|uniref:hypothetical protein n=1 Tax=Undibacterium sp. TJN19 TaxID=3413055 RepID=UPI003BF3AA40